MRIILGSFLVVALVSGASAQSACTTTATGATCGPTLSPSLSSVDGSVFVGTGAGYSPANAGAGVPPGGSVMTQAGSAQIALGGACFASVPANSLTRVFTSGGLTCVETGGNTPPPPTQSGGNLPALGIAAGVAGVAGVVGLIASQKSASP